MKLITILVTLLTYFNSVGQLTEKEYFEKAQFVWQNYVPENGQSNYVRGELLRAVEKLRDEAHRNGNINFHPDCHVILIEYLRKYLTNSGIFSRDQIETTNSHLDRLLEEEYPYTDDDIFDYLNDRVVDWTIEQNELIPHVKNAKLYC